MGIALPSPADHKPTVEELQKQNDLLKQLIELLTADNKELQQTIEEVGRSLNSDLADIKKILKRIAVRA